MKPLPRSQTEFTDAGFLAEFDLSLPGLRKVGSRLTANDLSGAKAALVDHFRTRSRPRWLFDLRDGQKGDSTRGVMSLRRAG